MPPQEQTADLPFPVSGVDVSRAFAEQEALTCPRGVNVRTYEPSALRARGGSRPGIAPYILPQLPGGPSVIQNLNTVDPTQEGALFDWQLTWDSVTPAPSGFTLDVSTPGSSLDWGTVPVSFGLNSRIPPRLIRSGGSGVQLNKNTMRTLRIPTINWSNPAQVTPGTALSGTQLNATATDPVTFVSVPGRFTYTPPAGTVLTAGLAQPLYTLFVPTDGTAYTINAKVVDINVVASGGGAKTPVVTWPPPSPRTLLPGIALTSADLNATATDPDTLAAVPGSFLYTPLAESDLMPGDPFTETATFTPTDPVAYTGASNSTAFE